MGVDFAMLPKFGGGHDCLGGTSSLERGTCAQPGEDAQVGGVGTPAPSWPLSQEAGLGFFLSR